MVLGKAEMVVDKKDKAIRSVSDNFPWPSIIKLNSYIKVPYKKIILTRKNILRRDGHKCAYCGRGDLTLTIDHIIPRARGGEDSWDNLVAACLHCNNKKGNKTPEEAGIKLRVKPYTPNHIMFIRNSVARMDETWKSYLFQS